VYLFFQESHGHLSLPTETPGNMFGHTGQGDTGSPSNISLVAGRMFRGFGKASDGFNNQYVSLNILRAY